MRLGVMIVRVDGDVENTGKDDEELEARIETRMREAERDDELRRNERNTGTNIL